MNRSLLILFAAVLLALSAGAARAAIMLSFDPVIQHVAPGQQANVDVRISGLGSNTPPSLGVFDLDVTFNDFILDFVGLTFGDPVLGNQLDLFGFGFNPSGVTEDPNPAVGLVDFFEISLDAAGDLDTMQAGSFILATLTFDVVANGVSPLNFTAVTLGDSLGNTLTATLFSGIVAVPEPGTLTLFVVGLTGLGFMMRRRRMA